MGITIELYRIRIGHFKSNKPRKMKLIELPRGKQSKVTILIFSFIIFQLCNGCFQTRSDFCRTTNAVNVKASNIDNSRVETACAFSWAQSGLLINKIQKIINGNRRAVGYRLAMWNCGIAHNSHFFKTRTSPRIFDDFSQKTMTCRGQLIKNEDMPRTIDKKRGQLF